jgi:hypothetical protein
MSGHRDGGSGGTEWEFTWPVPLKTGTYSAGDAVVWNATGAYYCKQTTRSAGGKVVVTDLTIATDQEHGSVVWDGPAKVKFDAVCEDGYPVLPSDATAGKVEKWAQGTIGTGTAVTTAIRDAIYGCFTDQINIMGKTMEEVLGTTNYYLIWVGGR